MENYKMKVLHIIAGDLIGGAARGAYWLHSGLKNIGVDSKILTDSKTTLGDSDIVTISRTKKDKFFSLIRALLNDLLTMFYMDRKKIIFSSGIFGFDITKFAEYKEADIVHFHWINNNFVNIRCLGKIDKPIVWTMRDMWPMTGGCHIAKALGCENYKYGCGNCKQLGSKSSYDISRYVLNRKKKYLPKTIKMVGISRWLSGEAKRSELFTGYDIRTISNNIETKDFFKIRKSIAKEMLGIETNKKIILVGSVNLHDFWKGFGKYLEALEVLEKDEYFLCFFGILDSNIINSLKFEYKNFGFLHDKVSLRLVYNCAHIFVAPTLMDAFGKTLAESMCCSTPVVCFDATGPKDIVTHKVDGYKAKPFDSRDLAYGIKWILNENHYAEICQNAREKILREFDSIVIAKKYLELYKEAINE